MKTNTHKNKADKTTFPVETVRTRPCSGFTLVELMIASVIAMVIAAAVLTSYIQFQKAMESQRFLAEVQQNVRVGLEFMTRDISMAGYGFKDVPASALSSWVNWVDLNENPTIEDGGQDGADRITVAGAYERVCALAQAASNTTEIVLETGGGEDLDTATKCLIYLGRCELARIVGIHGDRLTVTTDPEEIGHPLQYSHPVGAPVELVKVYTYSVYTPGYDSEEPPYLRREDYSGDNSYWFDQVVTAGIDDMQIETENNIITVKMRGRALERDTAYKNPEYEDQYRRIGMTNDVFIRNLQ